ncbi:DUF1653 domain-containing protein [Simiduia agarivorans]|uniref:DUF1653 domain-containing protein n=1 Tax=Simiduia agarivorans (strain DSM 21679 / JCM 13881 / BCRC 17597 / SA1) TaxID=1117647 RepID=K4KG90_SIMAS|nr:DUF1653 domain-containing protein [Simiduia agarivorans]AFU98109.1 hypothetical protein M5M_04510 [Simiduia agarivorans SA1 = DSM 21679]
MRISPGIYRHYKGALYQVAGVARHSETEEALVVYRCLYGDHSWWVRPLSMFQEQVDVAGERVPRFEFVKPGESLLDWPVPA